MFFVFSPVVSLLFRKEARSAPADGASGDKEVKDVDGVDADHRMYETSPVTHPIFLLSMSANYVLNCVWLVLWDRERLQASAVLLWVLTIFSLLAATFNYVKYSISYA